jgi:hypothetical protein
MKKILNLRTILTMLMVTMFVVTAFATPDEKPSKPGSVYDDPFSKPNYPSHP